jgi:endoglucanase
MAFTIKRGTNISHWLSQCEIFNADRATWFTRENMHHIAEVGFDHVRIPIDEMEMFEEDGSPNEAAFDFLEAALEWAAEVDLRAIVDLHILRAHHFLDEAPLLYTDPAAQAHFVDLWRRLSARLNHHPVDWVAYELLNEPVAPDDADWNRVAMAAFEVVRGLEPERTIVLGSNDTNRPHTFDALEIPEDDHCILTFHFYEPVVATHYTAPWVESGEYRGPIRYPGQPIAPADMAGLSQKAIDFIDERSIPRSRDEMAEMLAQPLAAREKTGHRLYCGEFGTYEKVPRPLRLAWTRDLVETFKALDIAYTIWAYKGDFGLLTADGWDTEMASILVG